MPEEPEAAGHIRHIYDSSLRLGEDLKGTGLFVNRCALDGEGLCFEYLRGETLEEALDQYLEKNDMEGLTQKIREYFSLFSEGGEPFEAAEDFKRVFGEVFFETPQTSRTVSDIDMIFSNVIQTEDRWELVDYEWTFFFPVPVKYLQYRCLYYYILGNTRENGFWERICTGPSGLRKRSRCSSLPWRNIFSSTSWGSTARTGPYMRRFPGRHRCQGIGKAGESET